MSANSFKLCIAVRLWKLQQNNNKRIISNNQQSIKPFYMGVFAVSRAFSLIHSHGTNTLSHTGLLYLYEPSKHRISPSPLLCCVSMQPLWGCEPMSQPQQWSSDMSFSPALVFPAVLPPHGSVSSSLNIWPVSFPQQSKSTLPLASFLSPAYKAMRGYHSVSGTSLSSPISLASQVRWSHLSCSLRCFSSIPSLDSLPWATGCTGFIDYTGTALYAFFFFPCCFYQVLLHSSSFYFSYL